MGDMIERMARAICFDAMIDGGPDSRYGTLPERVDNNWRDYTATARAALRAVTASDISYAMYAALVDVMNEPPNDESSEARVRRALAAAMQKASEE